MMQKLLAVLNKEWRLLWRDKVGLIFLFILPMCLVLFITLTSSVDSSKPRQLKLLLINKNAGQAISQALIDGLKKIDGLTMTQSIKKEKITEKKAEILVSNGEYQALIIIPDQFSQQMQQGLQQQMHRHKKTTKPKAIDIQFDPALPQNFQAQIEAATQLIIQNIELGLWQQAAIRTTVPSLIEIKSDYVKTEDSTISTPPNDVQQNVPAWTLFGMFFIITPLSGMIVKERRLGVMNRLWLAPISLFSIIWGKIGAFVCINILQLLLMLSVGVFVLPWFGLPTLDVTSHPGLILLIGLVASLAATGFGMLIGSLVNTPEQANVIGPFIIVILAAVGGIFVPVYLLPEALKEITHLSPMYWALESFIDIFVRHASFTQLLPNIIKLLVFAMISITMASFILGKRRT